MRERAERMREGKNLESRKSGESMKSEVSQNKRVFVPLLNMASSRLVALLVQYWSIFIMR